MQKAGLLNILRNVAGNQAQTGSKRHVVAAPFRNADHLPGATAPSCLSLLCFLLAPPALPFLFAVSLLLLRTQVGSQYLVSLGPEGGSSIAELSQNSRQIIIEPFAVPAPPFILGKHGRLIKLGAFAVEQIGRSSQGMHGIIGCPFIPGNIVPVRFPVGHSLITFRMALAATIKRAEILSQRRQGCQF
jgi:hypothetical protein